MFTIFANYLLGRQQVYEKETTEERLTTLEVDDEDWLLIEKTAPPTDNDSDSDLDLDRFTFEYLPSLDTSVTSIPHSVPVPNPEPTDYHETPFPMEESWFLTPPPCFTSAGPIFVETSPLENLLIEHPSMSVYQHSSVPKLPGAPSYRRCPSPHGSVASEQDEREIVEVIEVIEEIVATRRITAILMGQRHDDRLTASAQKIRQCQDNSTLKRNKLVRTNKARETNSTRNKRPRRSDRQRNHSGANNNRKC